MRLGFGSLIFVGVMLGSAALSMVRMLWVAAVLPKLDFGTYAAVTATGAFLGNIVSFGSVEGTVKIFPRLVAQGRIAEMLERARALFGRLALRALGLGVPLFVLGLTLSNHVLTIAGAATMFALSASYTSLVASMQRAIGDSRRLAAGTVFRALFTLLIVGVTAKAAGMVWTLVAEAASTMLGCYLSEKLFLRRAPEAASENIPSSTEPLAGVTSWDGLRVFLTYSAVSVPFYLDRLYVTATMGLARAAEYALLTLFVTAASLLVNAVAQRVGPEAIKRALRPGGAGSAVRYIFGWCIICAGIWAIVLASAAIVFAGGWLPGGLRKYEIDAAYLLPIGVLGVSQASALVEFLLIALDRERKMLRAALCYLFAVLAVAAGGAMVGIDLYTLIWLLAAARVVYWAALAFALRGHRGLDKPPAHA